MTQTRCELLQALEALSRLYPDMRFGQLLVNVANWAARNPDAVWDVEDEQLLDAAKKHLARRTQSRDEHAAAGLGQP
jgi:DNA phosphorothioation-dependent restriction protein DptG